jgi:acyl-coenzyme A thioesterase PaaI-like protein
MEYNNNLNRILSKLKSFPIFMQSFLRDIAIGRFVKLVGTAGVHFEKMTCHEVVLSLANKPKVQNHIGQIHAAATTLLAETATGMILGMNVPDNKLPLMKELSVKFIKRSEGQQTAIATLSNEQITLIRTTEKGELNIPVTVTDQTKEPVIIATMTWAWIPKKR